MKAPPAPADNRGVTATALPLPPPLPPAASPLSAEHLQQLAAAKVTGKRISRAVAVARFDGWSIAAFAGLTLLFGFTSLPSIVMAAGLGAVAFMELRGAGRIRQLQAEAARVLGFNQLALGALLIAYAVWQIYGQLTGTGEYAQIAASDPQLAQMLAPVEDITRMIVLGVYGGMIVVSLVAQGGLAMFYFTRAKYIRDYVQQTPAWIVTLQKTGSLL
jgi:hypothetical protein